MVMLIFHLTIIFFTVVPVLVVTHLMFMPFAGHRLRR